jgi:hypothetical protein
MDSLELPAGPGVHTINYAEPRICHVTNKDFQFISRVDQSRVELNAFGRLPVSLMFLSNFILLFSFDLVITLLIYIIISSFFV